MLKRFPLVICRSLPRAGFTVKYFIDFGIVDLPDRIVRNLDNDVGLVPIPLHLANGSVEAVLSGSISSR